MVLQAVATYFNHGLDFGYVIGIERTKHENMIIDAGLCSDNCAYFFAEGDISKIAATGALERCLEFYRRDHSGAERTCYYPEDFLHVNPISPDLDGIEHTVLIASKSPNRMRLFYEKTSLSNGRRRTSTPVLHEIKTNDAFEALEFKHSIWTHSQYNAPPMYFAAETKVSMPVGYAVEKVYEILTEHDSLAALTGEMGYTPSGVSVYVFGNLGCAKHEISKNF
jgi:hypothetical protein